MPAITTGPDGLDYFGWLDIAGWQFKYAGNGKLYPGAKMPNWGMALDRGVSAISHRILNGDSLDESFELGYDAWLRLGGHDSGIDYGAYVYFQPNKLTADETAQHTVMCLAPYPDLTMRLMGDFEAYNGPVLPPEIIGQWLFDFYTAWRRYTGNGGCIAGGDSFANPITVKGHNFDYLFTSQPRYNRPGVTPPLNVRQWAGFHDGIASRSRTAPSEIGNRGGLLERRQRTGVRMPRRWRPPYRLQHRATHQLPLDAAPQACTTRTGTSGHHPQHQPSPHPMETT